MFDIFIGDLNYGMFADKNKEVEDHPVFKKILKPFMTTEEEEQAMVLVFLLKIVIIIINIFL
jgi:uncharacterized membrane protein